MRTTDDSISNAPTVRSGATLGQAARVLRAASADVVVVLDASEQPIGILTERELVDSVAASRHPDFGTVDSWMRTDVVAMPSAGASRRVELPETDASSLIASSPSTTSR